MIIELAHESDVPWLAANDRHIATELLPRKIAANQILIVRDREIAGYLRYGLFWDNTPFLNLMYIVEERRGEGLGTRLLAFWETEMRNAGHGQVLTSTLSNENAQDFYRKNGYTDIGGFVLPGASLELIMLKRI